jgi:cyclase
MLVETGVKIIGIDTNNFDLPPSHMIREYARTGDANHLWPCHMYGRRQEYVQIEQLGRGRASLRRQLGPGGSAPFLRGKGPCYAQIASARLRSA